MITAIATAPAPAPAKPKITSFTDLKVWQEGHQLTLKIYEISKKSDQKETVSLFDQLKRSGIAATSFIAEGFASRTASEKLHLYYQAQGHFVGLKNQLLVARDLQAIGEADFSACLQHLEMAQKLLYGFIEKTKAFFNCTPKP